MARQGKCEYCLTFYKWKNDIKVIKVACPKCGRVLQRTSYSLKYKREYLNNPIKIRYL